MPTNPADSPIFGTLFGDDRMRAIWDDRAFLQRMLEVEAALARVQGRLGVIPEAAAASIGAAADVKNLRTDELASSVRSVGYPVVGLVKGLSRAAGEDAGRWTHWGATTQDIMDTALVLQIRQSLDMIEGELKATAAALARQAERHRSTVMAGRTHLQHALPTTFGLKCAIWLQPLLAHLTRLDQLRPRVQLVQFAGAAGTLASLGDKGMAVIEGLAADLGLGAPLAPWHVARDGLAEVVAWLGLVCGSLAKIATDVILMAQTEVAELSEPYVSGRGASSTMPQKRNPIASEYILAAHRGVTALVPLMLAAMPDDHERGTGPWQSEQLAIPQCFVLTGGALMHARTIADGMVVDAERMQRNLAATGGAIMAEAVMMGLAPTLGREDAHHAVKRATDIALEQHVTLAQALMRQPEVTRTMDESAIALLTDPSNYLGATHAFIDRVLRQAAAQT